METNNDHKKIKLNFNHPIKEIYPGIKSEEIKYIFKRISEDNKNQATSNNFNTHYNDYHTYRQIRLWQR